MLLANEDCRDEGEDGYDIGEDAGGGGTEFGDANVVEDVGEGAAKDAEDKEKENHAGRVGEEGKVAAVGDEHDGDEVKKAEEVLVDGDGDGLVVVDEFDEHDGEDDGNKHGTKEPGEANGVGVEVALATEKEHDAQADEGEHDADEGDGTYFLFESDGHAEGYKEGYGGYDD